VGTKFLLLAPLVQNRKGEYRELLDELRREGFTRVRLDGELADLEGIEKLAKQTRHTLDAVVDRLVMRDDLQSRLTDSVETALRVGDGRCIVHLIEGRQEDQLYSEKLACDHCGIAFPELSPQSFSFNAPLGMCKACNGLGTALKMDPAKSVEADLSLEEPRWTPPGASFPRR
jgi:excinuclease ABC subunit A